MGGKEGKTTRRDQGQRGNMKEENEEANLHGGEERGRKGRKRYLKRKNNGKVTRKKGMRTKMIEERKDGRQKDEGE